MSNSGFVILRGETLAFLLDEWRKLPPEDRGVITAEVAGDLREAAVRVEAPRTDTERLRAAGPVLSLQQHMELLLEDEFLQLPRDAHGREFWELVAKINHSMMSSEGEAVLRILGEE